MLATRPALIEVGMAEVAGSAGSPPIPRAQATLPKPPSPGLARKARPQQPTPRNVNSPQEKHPPHLFPARLWTGILPAAPNPGRQDRWGLLPAPLAGSKLSLTPGPPVTAGATDSSRGWRGGRPVGCRGLRRPGVPSLSRPTRHTPRPGPGPSSARPLGAPQP